MILPKLESGADFGFMCFLVVLVVCLVLHLLTSSGGGD